MIKIAYIIDHLRVGGAQRHLLEVVRGLDRERFKPEMWTAAAEPGDLAPVFERYGVPVRSFGIGSTMLSPRTLGAVKRVAGDLKGRGVSIAHGYLFEGNFLAGLVGRYARLPLTLASKRSLDRYTRLDRRLAAWLSNRLATRVTVNAEAVGNFVVAHEWCPPAKLVKLPNGVALPSAQDVSPPTSSQPDPRGSGPLVGMVGRLTWKKGYEFAIEAAATLRDRVPGIRVDIVGDGPLRAQLEAQVESSGLEKTIRFLGQRKDVPQLMTTFDCFMLSSVIEGMPNALLEAMALGRPVVTTSAGGSGEVVVDGESGLVVPPHDPHALAAAVERVLRDRTLAERLGEAAIRRVRDNFSLEAMLRGLEALYTSELARAGIGVGGAGRGADRRSAQG
jgi:glycosyltransferase involved in cell wall biosynthesis